MADAMKLVPADMLDEIACNLRSISCELANAGGKWTNASKTMMIDALRLEAASPPAREEAPAEGAGDLIEAGAKLLWNRFSSSAVEQWADETHKAEYRLAAADLLALHGRTSEPEAGEYVPVEDMEGHNHPRYGEGYFCTPDAIRSAHPAPATADKLRVAKEALERIERGDTEVFDDDLECMVTVTLDAEEASDIARQALAALNEQPQ